MIKPPHRYVDAIRMEHSTNMMRKLLDRFFDVEQPWQDVQHTIRVFPSPRSCVKSNMQHVKPEQMPPLMVRKAAWRR
jgi:hypothetical protein